MRTKTETEKYIEKRVLSWIGSAEKSVKEWKVEQLRSWREDYEDGEGERLLGLLQQGTDEDRAIICAEQSDDIHYQILSESAPDCFSEKEEEEVRRWMSKTGCWCDWGDEPKYVEFTEENIEKLIEKLYYAIHKKDIVKKTICLWDWSEGSIEDGCGYEDEVTGFRYTAWPSEKCLKDIEALFDGEAEVSEGMCCDLYLSYPEEQEEKIEALYEILREGLVYSIEE